MSYGWCAGEDGGQPSRDRAWLYKKSQFILCRVRFEFAQGVPVGWHVYQISDTVLGTSAAEV